jgi:hypothetical protein
MLELRTGKTGGLSDGGGKGGGEDGLVEGSDLDVDGRCPSGCLLERYESGFFESSALGRAGIRSAKNDDPMHCGARPRSAWECVLAAYE